MNGKFYFTRRGLDKLRREIDNLEKKLRDLQSQTAYVAEVGGDQYHDNASYEMLAIDIRGIDYRLTQAHLCINQAVIIEPPSSADTVVIGASVTILRDGEETRWEIVGFGESDPSHKLLAYNTPIASMIMGKRRGEIIEGVIAGRRTEIEILRISVGGRGEDAK